MVFSPWGIGAARRVRWRDGGLRGLLLLHHLLVGVGGWWQPRDVDDGRVDLVNKEGSNVVQKGEQGKGEIGRASCRERVCQYV